MAESFEKKHPVLAVVGPTATGKTALGVALAEQFGGEIISADSMQIYKGLDIGTAKVTPEETHGIPHHAVDLLEPDQTFSVADFTALAGEYIQDITGRGHLPLLVGGTGLYVQSLLYGVRFTAEKTPDGLREQLTAELEAIGPEAMYAKLQAVDPEAAAAIHPNNKVRVLRALEVCLQTGRPFSAYRTGVRRKRDFGIVKLGVDLPREVLYERIDRRVDLMMEAGLEAEARALYPFRRLNALQTVGYKELFAYFDGTCTREVAVALIKRNTRRYAKRQLTWFRRDGEIRWFAPDRTEEMISCIALAFRK